MKTRSVARSLMFAAMTITATACGSNAAPPKSAAIPADDQAVAQAAVSLLAPFGLQVQRSSIAVKPGARGGSELNLYVRPSRAQAANVYAARFMPLAAAIIPNLFQRYPGIQWIDLCQEPAQSSGDWETVPVTRLEISREGSGRIDWARADLATVLALVRTKPLEFSIEYHNGIGRTPVWSAAAARALTLGG